jgi:hypothetical protein
MRVVKNGIDLCNSYCIFIFRKSLKNIGIYMLMHTYHYVNVLIMLSYILSIRSYNQVEYRVVRLYTEIIFDILAKSLRKFKYCIYSWQHPFLSTNH